MKRRDDNHGTISGNLNAKRALQVRALLLTRDEKLEKHVMPTYDRETGEPDGGTRSAFVGVGGVCRMCGITRADALETVEGKTCDAAAFRRFSMPLDVTGGSDAVGRGGQPTNIAIKSPAHLLMQMNAAIAANNYGRDPLADVFAA